VSLHFFFDFASELSAVSAIALLWPPWTHSDAIAEPQETMPEHIVVQFIQEMNQK